MIRMGELATSTDRGAVLAAIGLGSCVGLALIDRGAGVAGLAHIMLPADTGRQPCSPASSPTPACRR